MSENDGSDKIFQLKRRHRLTLCAALFACEFAVTFQFIYSVTVLKLLGVPDAYVSLFGVISAISCLLVLPFIGKYSDRGNKFRRKCLLVSGCGCLMILSAVLLLAATFLKLVHDGDTVHRAENCSTINVTKPHSSSFALNEISGNNDSEDIALRDNLQDSLTLNFLCKASFRNHSNGESETSLTSPILGVLAFTLMDISIDIGYTNVRAFIVESVHSFWRGKVLSASSIMSSFGGCAVSVLGLLDYRPLFGQDKSPGLCKINFLSFLIITSALVSFTVTLLTGRYLRHTFSGERFTGVQSNISEGTILSPDLIRNAPKEKETMDNRATDVAHNNNCKYSCGIMKAFCQKARWTPSQIIRNLKKMKLSCRFVSLVLICLLAHLSGGTIMTFQGYFSNFLAEGVYGGKADAMEGSTLRLKYEEGIEAAVTGAVCYEAAFLMYNLVHGMISNKLGIIQEYILVTVLVVPLLVATSVVKDMVLFYILAALCGAYRNNFLRTPYVLAIECNEETVQLLVDAKTCALETSNINNEDEDSGSHGSNIAIVSTMIPLSFLVISAMMGPLLSATGNPAVPFYFSATSGIASCLVLFVLAFIRRRQGLQ